MLWVKFPQTLALLYAAVIAVVLADPGQGRTMVNTFEKRNLVDTLGPQLSSGASLYTPSSPAWAAQSLRWSTYSSPTFEFIVVPAVENDIAVTVTILDNPEGRSMLETNSKIYSYNTLPATTYPSLRRALAMALVLPLECSRTRS